MTADCCVFKFLRRSVVGKHLIRLQSETSVLKFLRHSVEGTYCELTNKLKGSQANGHIQRKIGDTTTHLIALLL